jgi:hypothetical protein
MRTQKAVGIEKAFEAEVTPVESVLEGRWDGAILAFSLYSSV